MGTWLWTWPRVCSRVDMLSAPHHILTWPPDSCCSDNTDTTTCSSPHCVWCRVSTSHCADITRGNRHGHLPLYCPPWCRVAAVSTAMSWCHEVTMSRVTCAHLASRLTTARCCWSHSSLVLVWAGRWWPWPGARNGRARPVTCTIYLPTVHRPASRTNIMTDFTGLLMCPRDTIARSNVRNCS